MIGLVNSALVNTSLPHIRARQGSNVPIPPVHQEKATPETVNTYIDFSLGTRVIEILNPSTGIVVSQLPSSLALYARQTEALTQHTQSTTAESSQAFDQFFQALEDKREASHAALTQAHASFASAIQSSLQFGQGGTQLFSEVV